MDSDNLDQPETKYYMGLNFSKTTMQALTDVTDSYLIQENFSRRNMEAGIADISFCKLP